MRRKCLVSVKMIVRQYVPFCQKETESYTLYIIHLIRLKYKGIVIIIKNCIKSLLGWYLYKHNQIPITFTNRFFSTPRTIFLANSDEISRLKSVTDFTGIIEIIVNTQPHKLPGVFHVSSGGVVSVLRASLKMKYIFFDKAKISVLFSMRRHISYEMIILILYENYKENNLRVNIHKLFLKCWQCFRNWNWTNKRKSEQAHFSNAIPFYFTLIHKMNGKLSIEYTKIF